MPRMYVSNDRKHIYPKNDGPDSADTVFTVLMVFVVVVAILIWRFFPPEEEKSSVCPDGCYCYTDSDGMEVTNCPDKEVWPRPPKEDMVGEWNCPAGCICREHFDAVIYSCPGATRMTEDGDVDGDVDSDTVLENMHFRDEGTNYIEM